MKTRTSVGISEETSGQFPVDSSSHAAADLRPTLVALLLFGSGLCALIYQTVSLREFRLIFGSSTAANAAVLSIFMAGLGAGGLILGAKVDRKARALRFYAQLEMAIALSAAVSPFLLWLARTAYFAIGGATSIGSLGASAIRLVFSAVVLGLPTFLMGGTLPAAARAIETDQDPARHALEKPFAVNLLEAERRWALAQIASALDRSGFSDYTREVLYSFEPNVPWERNFLQTRRDCYRAVADPLEAKAERDFVRFLKAEPPPLEPGQ